MYVILLFMAIIAGIIQGVTGFGAGIVMMIVLPMYFYVGVSAGISGTICVFLSAVMVWAYRKYIDVKMIVKPALLYMLTCSIAINYSNVIDQIVMKKIFGLFLIILSVYYLMINKQENSQTLKPYISIICVIISAICDGLFGIGGPLMVIYFMAKTTSTKEYLGSIQTFFLINGIYNTLFRIYKGIIGIDHFIVIVCGVIGISIGIFFANRLVDKLDAKLIKKITYIVIGISGLINIL